MSEEKQETPGSASKQLKEALADHISKASPKVRGLVIENLSQKEIERRTSAVVSVFEKVQALQKDIRKMESEGKPAGFNLRGDVIGEPVYSKEQLENIKKSKEKIAKLDKALAEAFEKNDWNQLLNLANEKQGN